MREVELIKKAPNRYNCQKIKLARQTCYIFLMAKSYTALAGCFAPAWTGDPVAIPFPSSITINYATANNTPLTDWYSVQSNKLLFCAASSSAIAPLLSYGQNALVSSSAGSYSEAGVTYIVFPTRTPGIGFVLASTASTGYPYYPLRTGAPQQLVTALVSSTSLSVTVKARLIKTGNIASNTYTISQTNMAEYGIIGKWTANLNPHGYVYIGSTTISVQTPTCSPNTQNINVNLPTITTSALPALQSTTGDTPFTLSFNCPSAVNVYMTLTDNSLPSNTSTIIIPAATTTSSGIGIQVKRNGTAISLGPDSSAVGTKNQFLVNSNVTGTLSIPLTANYIRTATASAGKIKAIATFTMSYQ